MSEWTSKKTAHFDNFVRWWKWKWLSNDAVNAFRPYFPYQMNCARMKAQFVLAHLDIFKPNSQRRPTKYCYIISVIVYKKKKFHCSTKLQLLAVYWQICNARVRDNSRHFCELNTSSAATKWKSRWKLSIVPNFT